MVCRAPCNRVQCLTARMWLTVFAPTQATPPQPRPPQQPLQPRAQDQSPQWQLELTQQMQTLQQQLQQLQQLQQQLLIQRGHQHLNGGAPGGHRPQSAMGTEQPQVGRPPLAAASALHKSGSGSGSGSALHKSAGDAADAPNNTAATLAAADPPALRADAKSDGRCLSTTCVSATATTATTAAAAARPSASNSSSAAVTRAPAKLAEASIKPQQSERAAVGATVRKTVAAKAADDDMASSDEDSDMELPDIVDDGPDAMDA